MCLERIKRFKNDAYKSSALEIRRRSVIGAIKHDRLAGSGNDKSSDHTVCEEDLRESCPILFGCRSVAQAENGVADNDR